VDAILTASSDALIHEGDAEDEEHDGGETLPRVR